MQLKISVESLLKRGTQAHQKEMLGSARQYLEKALQTVTNHPLQSEYTATKKTEIEDQLEEITSCLEKYECERRG